MLRESVFPENLVLYNSRSPLYLYNLAHIEPLSHALTGGPVLLRLEAPDAAADDLDFFLPFLPPLSGGGAGAGRAGETGPAAAAAGGLGGGSGGGVEDSGVSRSEDMEWRLASDARLFLAGSLGGGRSGGVAGGGLGGGMAGGCGESGSDGDGLDGDEAS